MYTIILVVLVCRERRRSQLSASELFGSCGLLLLYLISSRTLTLTLTALLTSRRRVPISFCHNFWHFMCQQIRIICLTFGYFGFWFFFFYLNCSFLLFLGWEGVLKCLMLNVSFAQRLICAWRTPVALSFRAVHTQTFEKRFTCIKADNQSAAPSSISHFTWLQYLKILLKYHFVIVRLCAYPCVCAKA